MNQNVMLCCRGSKLVTRVLAFPQVARGGLKSRLAGFTLIELMIVVVVIALLAAVAFPSYESYIRKARRADAKQALLRVQIEQEKWRSSNTTYTATLGTGGLGLATTSLDGYYTIGITAGSTSATAYTTTATAVSGKSQNSDSGCTTLTLAVAAGVESKTPAICW